VTVPPVNTYSPPDTERNLPTRLIVAVVQDYDANAITDALTQANFRLTRVGSTGGFLRMGSTTLLVGVEDWQVSRVKRMIMEHCRERMEVVPPDMLDIHAWYPSDVMEVPVGGAVVFTLKIVRFERL
jgi:uncharacterized protein YaaQ